MTPNIAWRQFMAPGVNFINVLLAAFTHEDPERAKKQLNLTVFFALLGSARVKAVQNRNG